MITSSQEFFKRYISNNCLKQSFHMIVHNSYSEEFLRALNHPQEIFERALQKRSSEEFFGRVLQKSSFKYLLGSLKSS